MIKKIEKNFLGWHALFFSPLFTLTSAPLFAPYLRISPLTRSISIGCVFSLLCASVVSLISMQKGLIFMQKLSIWVQCVDFQRVIAFFSTIFSLNKYALNIYAKHYKSMQFTRFGWICKVLQENAMRKNLRSVCGCLGAVVGACGAVYLVFLIVSKICIRKSIWKSGRMCCIFALAQGDMGYAGAVIARIQASLAAHTI